MSKMQVLRRGWSGVIALLTLALMLVVAGTPQAEPLLEFDDNLIEGGTLFYAGTGQQLTGSNLPFNTVLGVNTPQNANEDLLIIGGELNFATGNATQEGTLGGQPWVFEGGGNLSLVGNIPALGCNACTILSGTTSVGVFQANTGVFTAGTIGTLTVFQPLLDFYGLTALQDFAFTAEGTEFTLLPNAGFRALNNNADLIATGATTAVIPEPSTLLLLGGGLIVLYVWRRGRR